MKVRIRLIRIGRSHRPFYRIVAASAGVIENLGHYDPLSLEDSSGGKKVVLNMERLVFWIKNGAQPSDVVARLVRKIDASVLPKKLQQPHYPAPKVTASEAA